MRAYNSGIAWPVLFAQLGTVSWQTIEGWKRAAGKKNEVFNLADMRGRARRGQRIITEQQGDILLKCALSPNRPKVAEVIRIAKAVMAAHGIDNGHSPATYRRWLNHWKARNFHIWTFTRRGAKAWNDECASYLERDYSRINVGDVIVADGHVLNFEILNPWTGKLKRMILILWMDMKSSYPLGWEIMPTENTAAIASALRRAILTLGKMPQVAYLDNGKAFSSRFFNGADLSEANFAGLFERLGIRTIFAWPYHGQSKTIERFFGTFSEVERWCPTNTGASIADKPPRMMRGERLHRRVYEKIMDGRAITLEQAHRAVAAWFDTYAERPQQSGHLKGVAPRDVFLAGQGPGVDHEALRHLMMSQDIKTIRRNGVYFLGQHYNHPELYGRRHPVEIRYDLQDTSRLYVYDTSGEFLCEATPPEKVHPAAGILGTDEDRALLEEQIAHKKRQEKAAAVCARRLLEDEVIPEHRRRMAEIGVEPSESAGQSRSVKQIPRKMSASEAARIESEAAAIAVLPEASPDPVDDYTPVVADDAAELRRRLEAMGEADRYEALMEMEARGELMSKQWRAFMRYFEMTPDYERAQDYYEERRTVFAVMYQTQTAGVSE